MEWPVQKDLEQYLRTVPWRGPGKVNDRSRHNGRANFEMNGAVPVEDPLGWGGDDDGDDYEGVGAYLLRF